MIRVLGIAPYEGLKNMMDALVKTEEDLQLTSYVGDYEAGLKIAQESGFSNYDVIISRGGTADLIKEYSPIPVISIGMSYYDILNATKLAQNLGTPFALVGFPSTIHAATMLYDILKYDIPTYITKSNDDVEATLQTLLEKKIYTVVGDNMITRHAELQNMRAILITSGSESVAEAFRQASYIANYQLNIRRENAYYHTAMKLNSRNLAVLQQNGKIIYTTLTTTQKTSYHASLKRLQHSILQNGKQHQLRRINQKSVSFTGDCLIYNHEPLCIFEITELNSLQKSQFPFIEIKSTNEISNSFIRIFYKHSGPTELRKKIDSYIKAKIIILSGECGTGKDAMAEYLYSNGPYSSSLLFEIDCKNISEDHYENLFFNIDSPLMKKGYSFYFKDFDKLPAPLRLEILQLIKDTFSFGNQIIFSVSTNTQEENGISLCVQEILTQIAGVLLHLPALRKRIHEIPELITLYLSFLATQSTKQIAGIEPEGITYLQSFPWPGNLRQMCRIMNTLYQITSTSYISTSIVKDVLQTENAIYQFHAEPNSTININQSLDEIITDVIRKLLEQDGMTRTKAAKQLGICRATLWKYLK